MTSALIGHTGFVGGNVKAQRGFDELYDSANINLIEGRSFELVVCAGAPGAKWTANQKPDEDRAAIERLMGALAQVHARRFVLISTVDVYPRPIDVDETTVIEIGACHAYGRHRLLLERFVGQRFPAALIARLPALFGVGLKKNLVYDFLHENRLDLIHQDGVFQFYDLARIGRDLEMCLAARLGVVNFATEPVSVRDITSGVFERAFTNTLPPPAPRYDFKTIHAGLFGRNGPYIASRDEVLAGLKRFVQSARAARP